MQRVRLTITGTQCGCILLAMCLVGVDSVNTEKSTHVEYLLCYSMLLKSTVFWGAHKGGLA